MRQELKKSPSDKNTSASSADFCHIGNGFHFVGTISGSGLCVISGVADGTLNTAMVKVNQDATILGEVNCVQLDVAGNIQGKITTEDIFLRASARIKGDLSYSSIVIEKGAEIEGDIRLVGVSSTNVAMGANKDISAVGSQDGIARSGNIEQESDIDFYQLPFPQEIQELMVDAKKARLMLDDGMDHPELFELQATGVLVNRRRFEEHVHIGGSDILKLMVDDKIFTLNLPRHEGDQS